MSYGTFTVGELRKRLENVSDDAAVLIKPHNSEEAASPLTKEQKRSLPAWVVPWSYNTRETHNAYACNDDRYGGPAFLIELGALSP